TYYGYTGFPRHMVPEKFYLDLDKYVESAEGTKYPASLKWIDQLPLLSRERKQKLAERGHSDLKGIVEIPGLPRVFIPSQHMGYLLCNVQLPDSASLERTEAVLSRMGEIAHATDGIDATVAIAGQSILLNAYGSNFGTMFITLSGFDQRRSPDLY